MRDDDTPLALDGRHDGVLAREGCLNRVVHGLHLDAFVFGMRPARSASRGAALGASRLPQGAQHPPPDPWFGLAPASLPEVLHALPVSFGSSTCGVARVGWLGWLGALNFAEPVLLNLSSLFAKCAIRLTSSSVELGTGDRDCVALLEGWLLSGQACSGRGCSFLLVG
jgi:hypothetical protein